MSQGPHDPRDNQPEDDANFDWLYSGQPNEASEPAEDATRIMPTVPREAPHPAADAYPPPLSTPSPAPLPDEGPILPPPKGSAPRPHTRVRWRRVVLLFVVLPLVAWLVFLIAVPVISWNRITRVDAFPTGARPAAGQGTNYLLVGSDSRRGLTTDQMNKLGVGGVEVGAGRTDTIMILHLGQGPATLLSIPRDSWVPIPGHGDGKINSAFTYGGAPLLIQTIENNTGLHIDHYAEIGLGGFVKAVDGVGGVQICPTKDLIDVKANLNIKQGCQNADGATALAWSRSRDAFALGDLARGENQRQIVKEVGDKAISPSTILLPWRYLDMNDAAVAGLTIDNQMSMWNMISFARGMSSVSKNCTMPLTGLANPLHWNKAQASQLMTYFKNDDTADIPAALCTPSGLPQ